MGGPNCQSAPSSPPARLLVVDDDRYVREVLSRWLTAEGYECETAVSAEEAWDLLEHDSCSLLMADIGLPGKSGMDLLSVVRQRKPSVAVIMVTAATDRRTAIRALEMGAYGYIIKPFEQNEVIINVVNALERRRLVLERQVCERDLEERVRKQTEEVRVSREEIALRLLAAQEYRHDETGAHIRRIGLYAERLGARIGRCEEETEMLRLAATMHDVGKIGIPDAILRKPGKLSSEEWEIMKTHTTIGGRILEGTAIPLLNLSRDIALYHHERWDGSGYPEGLCGEDIPEAARVVAMTDVYDALVHERVYRPAVPEQEALRIMRGGSGRHFDARILDAFLEILPELRRIRQVVGALRQAESPAESGSLRSVPKRTGKREESWERGLT